MTRIAQVVAALAFLGLAPLTAFAQSPDRAWVVGTCGTPPQTYTSGDVQPLTMGTDGKACVNAAVTVGAVTVGVTPGTLTSTNPVSPPVMAAVTTPGSSNFTTGQLQIVTQTTGGSLNVKITGGAAADGTVAISGGITPGTLTSTAPLSAPNLGATLGAQANYTTGQLNLAGITSGGAVMTTPVPNFWSGAGGWHAIGITVANTTNSTLVASGPRTLLGMANLSVNTTSGFIRIYDTSSAPTCSSATNYKGSFPIPVQSGSGPTTSAPLASGYTINFGPFGVALANGLGYCLTSDGQSTANVGIGSTPNFINIFYN